jgi:hypothetical protein
MTRLQLCKALQERRGLRLTPTIEPVEVLLRYLPAQVVRDICHATDGGVCIEIADDSVCFERGALLREELRLMNTRSQPSLSNMQRSQNTTSRATWPQLGYMCDPPGNESVSDAITTWTPTTISIGNERGQLEFPAPSWKKFLRLLKDPDDCRRGNPASAKSSLARRNFPFGGPSG